MEADKVILPDNDGVKRYQVDLLKGLALATLEADLHDASGLLHGVDGRAALANIVGQRLFTINIGA